MTKKKKKKLLLFCIECFKDVNPKIIPRHDPAWFDSYFCPECDNEIARKSDRGAVMWTGREFKEASF